MGSLNWHFKWSTVSNGENLAAAHSFRPGLAKFCRSTHFLQLALNRLVGKRKHLDRQTFGPLERKEAERSFNLVVYTSSLTVTPFLPSILTACCMKRGNSSEMLLTRLPKNCCITECIDKFKSIDNWFIAWGEFTYNAALVLLSQTSKQYMNNFYAENRENLSPQAISMRNTMSNYSNNYCYQGIKYIRSQFANQQTTLL